MPETQSISEDRLMTILAMLPVPIRVLREEAEGLSHWEVKPAGHGTAPLFEDALKQALTYALTSLQEQSPFGGKSCSRGANELSSNDPR